MTFDLFNQGPFELSRRLHGYSDLVRRWKRLHGGAHPFGRTPFPGKTTFDAVEELRDDDPMRAPLLRAVHRLTQERILVPYVEHDWMLERRTPVPVREPKELAMTRCELRAALLKSPQRTREAWARSWAREEKPLSDHRREIWSARREIDARLGGVDSRVLHDPFAGDSGASGAGEDATAPSTSTTAISERELPQEVASPPAARDRWEMAWELLESTRGGAESTMVPGWDGWLDGALAADAHDGWPARLAPDSLRRLFAAPELFRGVILEPGPLPERWVPTSFPRAAYQMGRAVSAALAPSSVPYVVARDWDDLAGHRIGSLFFLWTFSRTFSKRVLGLSGESARRFERAMRVALLAHVRLSAARILVADAAHEGGEALRDRFAEASATLLLDRELPPSALFARFSVRSDEAARFAGLLSALSLYRELVLTYDEDWWLSPRAQEQLRAEWSGVAPVAIPEDEARTGLLALSTWWEVL